MRTFKTFLQEARSNTVGAQNLPREQVKEQLKSGMFNDALKGKTKIYRGFDDYFSKMDYFLMEPSKHLRVSANTYNFYTFLTSEYLSNWKEIPKRNRSIICSTSDDRAYDFGSVYYVLPKNGSKIGVCSTTDFWFAFETTIKDFIEFIGYSESSLEDFNNFFSNVASFYKRSLNSDSGILSMLKALDKDIASTARLNDDEIEKFKEKKKDNDYLDEVMRVLYYCKENNISNSTKLLESLLDPKKNAIYVAKAGDKIPYDNEVWTSDTCLCIRKEELESLLSEIKGEKNENI